LSAQFAEFVRPFKQTRWLKESALAFGQLRAAAFFVLNKVD
jgi:hypothetical protein